MGRENIADAEELLSKIFPPQNVLALGAVMPQRLARLSAFSTDPVTLVHADEAFTTQIAANQKTSIETKFLAIHAEAGDARFFKSSLDRESGFVPVTALSSIWKNLELVSEQTCQAITLKDFLSQQETAYSWLLTDRLDSLSLFSQDPDALSSFDVIQVRATAEDQSKELTSSPRMIEYLSRNGFALIAREPERHPALELLLFARNRAGQLRHLQDQVDKYEAGEDTDAVKQKKIAMNNLSALEKRYADLHARNQKTEKLVADLLARLERAEAAMTNDA